MAAGVYSTAGAVVGVIQGLFSVLPEKSFSQTTSYCVKEAYRTAGLCAGIVTGFTMNVAKPMLQIQGKRLVQGIQASPIKYRIKDLESLMNDHMAKSQVGVP